MHALGSQMFFENNPFEAVKGRNDLNGLQKIRLLLAQNQSDTESFPSFCRLSTSGSCPQYSLQQRKNCIINIIL